MQAFFLLPIPGYCEEYLTLAKPLSMCRILRYTQNDKMQLVQHQSLQPVRSNRKIFNRYT
jgi:hypothetical protein